jgi:TolB-like protein
MIVFLLTGTDLLYAKKLNILVNPFRNRSGTQYSWIAYGISDTVISDLNTLRGINVISDEDREKAIKEMELGQTGILKEAVMVKIGILTGADLVFSGDYRVSGDDVRVNAKLVRVKTGKLKKKIALRGKLKEIFALQDRVVFALLAESKKIRIKDVEPVVIKNEEITRIRKKYKPAFTAYQWYCRGLEARYIEADKAMTFFRKAISIDGNYTDALLKAAYVSGSTLDRFSEALGFLKRAEGVLKKRGDVETSQYAYMLRIYGTISTIKGRHKEALNYYHRSRELYEKLKLNESVDYSILLTYLGQQYSYVGDVDEALDYYFRSKDLMELLKITDSNAYSALMNNIGIAYAYKGKYKRALEFYIKSREIKDKQGLTETSNYTLVLNNIATSFFSLKNFDKALEIYLQVKKLMERLGLTETKEYGSVLMNIANVYARKKKYNKAIPLFRESEKKWRKLGLTKTRSFAKLLMNMGTAYRSNKQREKGLSYYKNSRKLMEGLGLQNTSSYGNLLLNTGVLYYNIKKRKIACRHFDLAYKAYRRAKFKGKLKKTAKSFTRQCKKKGWY